MSIFTSFSEYVVGKLQKSKDLPNRDYQFLLWYSVAWSSDHNSRLVSSELPLDLKSALTGAEV